jgi:NADPH-dependent 2,4-dienoyl-CoA reductase/sulfur reductase-like enzyme
VLASASNRLRSRRASPWVNCASRQAASGAPGWDAATAVSSAAELGIPNAVDVVVVGSGAAGLMAALIAAVGGRRVLVVESEASGAAPEMCQAPGR